MLRCTRFTSQTSDETIFYNGIPNPLDAVFLLQHTVLLLWKMLTEAKGQSKVVVISPARLILKGKWDANPLLAAPKIEMICFTELHTLFHEMPGRMYRLTETPLFRHQSGASLRIFRCYIRRKTIYIVSAFGTAYSVKIRTMKKYFSGYINIYTAVA